jgi:hypothetical protein
MIKIPSAIVIPEARRRGVVTRLNDNRGRRAIHHNIPIVAAVVVVMDRPSMPVAAAQGHCQGSKEHQSDDRTGYCQDSLSRVHGSNLLLPIRLVLPTTHSDKDTPERRRLDFSTKD